MKEFKRLEPPIFILGISPRSGTNFLFELLRLHPALDVASTVEEDFLLFGAHHLQEYVSHIARRWDTQWGISEADSADLLRTLGEAGLQFLRRRQQRSELRLITKTPEIHNLPLFFKLFPNAQLLIVVRDGRAVVESKINSFEADFANAAHNWANAANLILDFEKSASSTNFRIIKYESLYQHTRDCMHTLLDFLGLDAGVYPFEQIAALPVRGSSVFHGPSGKLDWTPVEKTDAFRPLDRFQHWMPQQHLEFNSIAGDALERFGYALEEPLYIKAQIRQAPHDETLNVVTRLDTGSRVLMPTASVSILESFTKFLSLREHFQRCALQAAELPKFIEFSMKCSEVGLLRSSSEFLESLKARHQPLAAEPLQPTVIFIRTCDRPAFLERVMASLVATNATNLPKIYVLDDSRSQAIQLANATIIDKFGAAHAQTVFYLGEEWQQDFIRRLSQVFPEYEGVIRFILEPRSEGVFSAGRLLNLATLAFAGRRMLTYDDDYIVDHAWQHRDASTDTLYITDERAHCLEGFASEEDLLSSSIALAVNPVQAHSEFLGRSLSAILTSSGSLLPDKVSLKDMSTYFASQLSPSSRVLTTGNGVIGRPIQPDATLGWFAKPSNSVPVWASNKNYAAWMTGHHVFVSHKSLVILPYNFGLPVGIDNTQLMPPTIPTGKREDTLFTFLLHRIHQSSVHLEFPWAVAHMREARDWRNATLGAPVGICLAQVIMFSLENALRSSGGMGTAESRMMMIGAALSEMSTQPNQSLQATLLSYLDDLSSSHHMKLMQVLSGEGIKDAGLIADVEHALQISKQAQLNESRTVVLEDTHCPKDEAAQLRWLQHELMFYAQALLIWPILWNYCKDNADFVFAIDTAGDCPNARNSAI